MKEFLVFAIFAAICMALGSYLSSGSHGGGDDNCVTIGRASDC